MVAKSVPLPPDYWIALDAKSAELGISRPELFRRLVERAGILPNVPLPAPLDGVPKRIGSRPPVKRPAPRTVQELVTGSENTPGTPAWRRAKSATAAGRLEIQAFDAGPDY